MNWWNVLEIHYDSDLKTIKKAYAKLLKIYNPEDDADGYQKLRKAYDEAIKHAKRNNKNQDTQEFINDNFGENISTNENTDESYYNEQIPTTLNSYVEEQDININLHEQIIIRSHSSSSDIHYEKEDATLKLNKQISEFLNRLNEIYKDMSLRINTEMWKELLNMDVIWNVSAFSIIEDEMFKFLVNHKYLPSDIWLILNNNFNWTKNEIILYEKYSTNIVDEFLNNVKNPNKLKYDYLESLNSQYADDYLSFREKACVSLSKGEYYQAEKDLFSAYVIFKEDPELLRLLGILYNNLEDFNNALSKL